jgi:hypothetical protein
MDLIDEIINHIYEINKDEIDEYFRHLGTSLEDYINVVNNYLLKYLKDVKE